MFHSLLGFGQFLRQTSKDCVSVTQPIIHRFNVHRAGQILRDAWRFLSEHNLIWGHSYRHVGGCIIRPLDPCQKAPPSQWSLVNESLQILLNDAIHYLGLAIGLRVVHGAHVQLCAAKFK